jgi:hypothetical protein
VTARAWLGNLPKGGFFRSNRPQLLESHAATVPELRAMEGLNE